MMPWAKLMVSPMPARQPPQSRKAARSWSVRLARHVRSNTTAPRRSAPGSSQDIMLPNWGLKRRVRPVGPHMLPAWVEPPTCPASFPVNRPNPL